MDLIQSEERISPLTMPKECKWIAGVNANEMSEHIDAGIQETCLWVISITMRGWQASQTHLCVAGGIRTMIEKEILPAMLVDYYYICQWNSCDSISNELL